MIAFRLTLEVLGKNTIAISSTGCKAVIMQMGVPKTPHFHVLFENSPAVFSVSIPETPYSFPTANLRRHWDQTSPSAQRPAEGRSCAPTAGQPMIQRPPNQRDRLLTTLTPRCLSSKP